jgi:sugar phosphate isomerase/epimerase
MKFAVCNEVFTGWPWERICAFARETGFEGIEIAPMTFATSVTEVSAAQRSQIRRAAQDHGLAIPALHMLMFSPKGLHTNSPDPATRRTAVEYLKALIGFAADIGCPVMVYGSPPSRAVHPSLTYRQARAYMKESFLACLDLARQHNVTICIEPLPSDCTDLFSSVEGALNFVCDVNHPNMGLMVDTKAMSNDVRPVANTIRAFAPEIRHVHLNDHIGVAPGFGTLDFRPILHALTQIGYKHWLSLEPFTFRPDAQSNVAVSLRYLKAVLAEVSQAPA